MTRFRVVRTADPYRISRSKSIERYPAVLGPSGVHREAALYIHELAAWRSQSAGTLYDVANIICDWCGHLLTRGLCWSKPTAETYNMWLLDMAVHRTRLSRKASVVFDWYRFLSGDHDPHGDFEAFARSISARPQAHTVEPKLRFKSPVGAKLKKGFRPVPSREEAARVCRQALSICDKDLAERNWLIARTAHETGLRAAGIASLTIGTIDHLLRSRSLLQVHEKVDLILDNGRRAAIRAGIYQLEQLGFQRLYVEITEKRSKTRMVGFPLNLVLALLEYIWASRAAIRPCRRRPEVSEALWVSKKSAGPLTRGAVCDMLASLFVEVGIKGSGHSLRAAFITERAEELLVQAREKFGANFDELTILHELCELAGHAQPSTLRNYLDLARIRHAVSRS